MSTNLEIESKVMITEDEYISLLANLKTKKTYKQINYYLSNKENTSNESKLGIRVRKVRGIYELTVKVPKDDGKLEINQILSLKSYVFLKYFGVFPQGEVFDYLTINKLEDTNKLKIIGRLTTYRTDIKYNESKISIDKSKYNHKVDYEIECESSSKGESLKDMLLFLLEHNIEYKKSEHTKLARFLLSK